MIIKLIFTMPYVAALIEWSQQAIASLGFLGVFLVSFVGSATVILPAPVFLAIFIAGKVMNPWLVGLIGGPGAAFGELVAYYVGRGGKKLVRKQEHHKLLEKAKVWLEKRGAFPVIVLFAATPLPDDVIGILCGLIKYDIKKFFVATLIGKIVLTTALAWAGFYGMEAVLQILEGRDLPILLLTVAGAVAIFLVFKFLEKRKQRNTLPYSWHKDKKVSTRNL